jgi:nitrogen-specific signal transduction histidine kinase/HAMP domain-containing protein
MRFRIHVHGLAVKLSVAFSLVVAVSAAILAVSAYMDEKVVLQREAQARYDSIATNLAFNAEYGALTRNIPVLDQLLKGVKREEDVNFAEIDDMSGAPLAREGVRADPGVLVSKPVFLRRILPTDNVEYLFGGEDKAPRDETALGEPERIGIVLVEFDTTLIHEKLAKMQQRAAAVSLLTVIFGVILSGIFSRLLVAPLQDLVHATSRVARGDLESVLKSKSRDEIGELAAAFNIMTANLKNSTVSRDYLDGLLDAIPDAIIVVGVDGVVKTVNQGALHLSGFGEKELLGAPLDKALSSDGGWMIPKKGESIPISVSTGGLSDKDGRSLGTVYVAHDVRPMHKLQERLLQTEKMAAVGQLAAGVSHEINNPLGVILGFAQGLCRRLEPGHALEVPLRSIEREAMRCKDLVQDLLTFSRASHVEREPMDINAAVEGALSLIQAQARMDRAEVRQVLAPGLPKVYGSKNQIQQVVINLAKNALDAMPQGGAVTVLTELEEGSRSWVRLRVQDQGTGIPPEILPRIFEPFFTTKPVGRGTGLGLSLVYEIVKKHSGTLDVKSRPGATEFIIRLPVRTGRESEAMKVSPGAPGEEQKA